MKKQEEDFDFGFTTIDDPSTDLEATSFQLDDYKVRLQKMYDAIIPLLNNLEKNPDQEMIKWPNRDKKIKEFKTRLKNILEGK
ncbi:hypothetical protein EBS02_11700 [bacterium]|nr:hypothetical protein [bacterium]